MARPRRRVWPLTALGLALLIPLLFVAFKISRLSPSQVERPPPTSEGNSSWRARPGQVEAFSDSLASRLQRSLTDLGVEEIHRARSKREGFLTETSVRVPRDLPLAVCNLEVVREAGQIGGAVLSAVEARDGLSLIVQAGLGGSATDRIVLETDPNAARPAGAVALIVCGTQGQGEQALNGFCDLEQMITLALPPGQEGRVSARALANGHGVMIHLPMGAESGRWGAVLRQAMDRVPDAAGVINDLAGGRVTEDERAMAALMSEVRRRGLFFVDSRASASSVAYRTALKMRVRSGESVLRIDEEDGVDAIQEALRRLADLSASEGRAIGVGYARPNTLTALRGTLPGLERRGVRFVRAEMVVRK